MEQDMGNSSTLMVYQTEANLMALLFLTGHFYME